MSPRKPKRGRPPLHGKAGVRFQIHITVDVERFLRKLGEGSLSAGITRAAELHKKSNPRA
jgi:hypothetical protein